jgi:hypothetical protein
MEALHSSETSVITRATQRNIPEDSSCYNLIDHLIVPDRKINSLRVPHLACSFPGPMFGIPCDRIDEGICSSVLGSPKSTRRHERESATR